MPASARAMYAPRENPKMHILSSAWSDNSRDEQRYFDYFFEERTMLHQKLISSYEQCNRKQSKLKRTTHP